MRAAQPLIAWAALSHRIRDLAPGLAVALTIAAAANFVSLAYGGPVMLLALLIGMALNFLAISPAAQSGLSFAARPVLQAGVALLGLRVSFDEVATLGLEPILLVVAGVVAAVAAGVAIARIGRHDTTFGLLAGGATGICGASAALAIASVLPRTERSERQTAFVIVAVTSFSTIAMVLYPVLAHWLGFDDRTTGILLGATIHDVAQVVGAGYAVSPEAGDIATIVKLFRVALLLPTVFIISLIYSRAANRALRTVPPLPLFAVVFGVLVVINSLHLAPAAVAGPTIEFSRWCLVVAVGAIGVRTSIPEMLRIGRAAIAVPAGATLALLGLVVAVLSLPS